MYKRHSALIRYKGGLSRVHVHNLHPGANLHPIVSRSCANKSCSYVPRFELKFYTRYIVLWSNSLCLNVLGDQRSCITSGYVCERYFYCGVLV